jgi:tetratricopeptide (TPR) repeat protein
VGNYLERLALKGDLGLVCELIDLGEEFIYVCTTPIVLHLKTSGVNETLDILLQNPTENDWLVLLKVDKALDELTLDPLRREMAFSALSISDFSSKAAVQYGLKGILLVHHSEEGFLSIIVQNGIQYKDDAEISNSLGEVFYHFGDYDKALDFYKQSFDVRLKTFGASHPDVAYSYNKLGLVFGRKGEYAKAMESLQKGLELRAKIFGAEDLSVAKSKNNIGVVWKNKGAFDKALVFYHQSLEILLKTLGKWHPLVAKSYNNIGSLWEKKGEYDKALEFYQKCLDIELKTLGAEHPYVAESINYIALVKISKKANKTRY